MRLVLIFSIFTWPLVARVVRGELLTLEGRQLVSFEGRQFLLAARPGGAGNLRSMLRHLFPYAAGPIVVAAALIVGQTIMTEAVISFFGFGVLQPTPDWGWEIQDEYAYAAALPVQLLAPGLAILLTVLSANLIADGLRDALDPALATRPYRALGNLLPAGKATKPPLRHPARPSAESQRASWVSRAATWAKDPRAISGPALSAPSGIRRSRRAPA